MQLIIIKIEKNGNDEAVILNGEIILSVDPSTGECTRNVYDVALSLSNALNLNIESHKHHPDVNWTWDDVIKDLSMKKIIKQNEGVVELLNTTITDWRLSEGHTSDDLLPEHRGEYSLKMEMNIRSKQVFFSVYNKAFNKHGAAAYPMGLNGLIEIRNGVPAISIGITPDENIIHVLSNNSNELAVIKESESMASTLTPVDFSTHKDVGLVFSVDNNEALHEARLILADDTFSNYDFGDVDVKDDNGWEVDDNRWSKVVFLECTCDRSSVKKELEIIFVKGGTHITSVGC